MNYRSALQALIADLRNHAEQLRTGDRRTRRSRKLAEFRSFHYGEDDKFYPLDGGGRPWRKHRIAVSRAALAAAGYEEYYRTWRWMPQADPWRNVSLGGEMPLYHWASTGDGERETRLSRARFLERLADMLESVLQRITKAGPSDKD